jgi:hypothetical protein
MEKEVSPLEKLQREYKRAQQRSLEHVHSYNQGLRSELDRIVSLRDPKKQLSAAQEGIEIFKSYADADDNALSNARKSGSIRVFKRSS